MSKILIIDDQAPIRRVLRDILENEKYQVEDVGSGPEALQIIKEQDFDAVFCDIKMPDMDGIEVLEAIKKDSDTPVIMASTPSTNPHHLAQRPGQEESGNRKQGAQESREASERNDRPVGAHDGSQGDDREGGTHQREGTHYGRKRDRQGTCSAAVARTQYTPTN